MNGHGYYKHNSGYSYEGIFENGYPSKMATKLNIIMVETNSPELNEKSKIIEGMQPFKVTVQSVNDEDQVFQGLLFAC